MNRYVKALIDRIEVDEHLGHYQKLTHAGRARFLGELFRAATAQKRREVPAQQRALEERRFTPALCKSFLKRLRAKKS